MKNEAIVIIPGLDAKKVGFALDRMIEKLSKQENVKNVKLGAKDEHYKQSIELTFNTDNRKKKIDVYEVFWADIIGENYDTDIPTYKKAIFGVELITFWFFSTIWKAALKNKFIFVGVIFSGIVLSLWYLSILFLLITSLLNSAEVSDFLGITNAIEMEKHWVLKNTTWAFVTILLAVVPTSIILRISGFTMKYLKSGLVRESIKARICKVMNGILKQDDLDRITLFAHSFGAVPALDYLSDFKNPGSVKVRCISAGAPISFLAHKSPFIKRKMKECIANPQIEEWVDYFSREDYMCSYVKLDGQNANFNSIDLDMDSSWLNRISSKVHLQYFDDKRVMNKVLAE
jgi:hypothetical protein